MRQSRLIQEFAKGHQFLKFSGLPPSSNTTAQSQRDTFSAQLSQQTDLPAIKPTDWSEIFLLLASKTKTGRIIVLLDEISWMGSEDATFLGKLKIIWDEALSHNPKLILVLCGSVSTWIEKNIVSSTGYFGRISKQIDLEPLMLSEANEMLDNVGFKRSFYEKFRILSVTGTIPWYIEHIQSDIDADTNIRELCFRKGSLQFENLVLNNAKDIIQSLNIPVDTIVQSGSFIQRKTTRQKGVQIDYLIQTHFNTLFVCEIKFSRSPLSKNIISEVQNKINAISKPHKLACIPILIHVNGVDDSLIEEDYFMKIIDFGSLLVAAE